MADDLRDRGNHHDRAIPHLLLHADGPARDGAVAIAGRERPGDRAREVRAHGADERARQVRQEEAVAGRLEPHRAVDGLHLPAQQHHSTGVILLHTHHRRHHLPRQDDDREAAVHRPSVRSGCHLRRRVLLRQLALRPPRHLHRSLGAAYHAGVHPVPGEPRPPRAVRGGLPDGHQLLRAGAPGQRAGLGRRRQRLEP